MLSGLESLVTWGVGVPGTSCKPVVCVSVDWQCVFLVCYVHIVLLVICDTVGASVTLFVFRWIYFWVIF
jgi:hypothetical protein